MNIGIYDPYLDTLGGGERYCLDIASCFSSGHTVSFFWDDPGILAKASKRFHIDTSSLRTVPNIWNTKGIAARMRGTKGYDALFYVSNGSIPVSFAKKTFLIFQFPVPWVDGKKYTTQFKMRRIKKVLCYSEFVKKHIDKTFGINALVLPPAVDLDAFVPQEKENLILSVGRFTGAMNAKKHDVLIDAFKTLAKKDGKDWRLVIAGGVLPSDAAVVEKLKKQAKGFRITLEANISFTKLQSLYGKAKIYWHAAGYGEDLIKHPERAEHFGITTIEAMSAGAVPVVFGAGGQAEIVQDKKSGLLWETPAQLVARTATLIHNEKMRSLLVAGGRTRSRRYAKEQFCAAAGALL